MSDISGNGPVNPIGLYKLFIPASSKYCTLHEQRSRYCAILNQAIKSATYANQEPTASSVYLLYLEMFP